jgi:AcrR family transcriptional regulator
MSPRPRLQSDAAILEAAFQVVNQTGPDRFTLADVGEKIGLSAATLVQRFGSKRGLLLKMFEQSIGLIDDRFTAALISNQSPIDCLYAAAVERFSVFDMPDTLANRFSFILIELSDPEFRTYVADSTAKAVSGYKTMLDNAVAAGELDSGFDSQIVAETIHSMTLGSLMMWAILRDGAPGDRIRQNLDALIRPLQPLARAES